MKVVLLRHGESEWNRENRFTGWTDVDLSSKGMEEAREAGKYLQEQGYFFDLTFTSYLKRAIKTLDLVLEEMDLLWLPVKKSWRLNERHYGALQGLNKAETALKYGDEQVKIWRRSYDILPPVLAPNDPRNPRNDRRYAEIPEREIPLAESLEKTVERVIPYWKTEIWPEIQKEKRILISAHGNSLRALVKYLESLDNQTIVELNIPTGIPLVYELDRAGKVLDKFYLGDQAKIEAEINKVANQGKAGKV